MAWRWSLSATETSVDSTSGKGLLTFRDPALGARAPLRGLFYDPASHSLSPAFTMDDPKQSGGEIAHLNVDSTGLALDLDTPGDMGVEYSAQFLENITINTNKDFQKQYLALGGHNAVFNFPNDGTHSWG